MDPTEETNPKTSSEETETELAVVDVSINVEENDDLPLKAETVHSRRLSFQHVYHLAVDPAQDDRATELKILSFLPPHMRAFHAAWISFFFAFFSWFSMSALLPWIQSDLSLTNEQLWATNITSVASTVAMRFIVGPLCDRFGPRRVMTATLILGSIPVYLVGTATSYAGLATVRFFIGVLGGSFVMCQYWTSQMFAKNIIGTTNAVAAGWGNLGGGVTQLFMGSAMMPLFIAFYNGDSEKAWRTAFIVPATMTIVVALCSYYFAEDCPHGNFRDMKRRGEPMPPKKGGASFLAAGKNFNTLIMFLQYGACFGVELTMFNLAPVYFVKRFGQNKEAAAAISSIFGFMNVFSRGTGGLVSDILNRWLGMRGRLITHFAILLIEGILIVVFAQQSNLSLAIFVMVLFSISVQAAAGTSYSIVPFIDPVNLGAVSGIVGAGGNIGAVAYGFLFMFGKSNEDALHNLGYIVIGLSFLTFCIAIPGHEMLIGGSNDESKQQSNSRQVFGQRRERVAEKEVELPESADTESA